MGRLFLPEIDFGSRLGAAACSGYPHASMRERRPLICVTLALVALPALWPTEGLLLSARVPLDVFEGHGDRQAI
jgi:hypothetical protein